MRNMAKNLDAPMVTLKYSTRIFVFKLYDDMSDVISGALARSASVYLLVPWHHDGVICLRKEVLLVKFLVHASWSAALQIFECS